ncbi:MAG TPA: aminotransferase class IV [Desulfotignum sp.]|nr:aminotransferase class IV [Desulfotignum sp.]
MLSDRKVFMNGKFTAWEQAGIHMMSHSFSRGSAIFEVLSVHDIPGTGPCVFRLDKHVQRLFSSASALGMVPGLSPESVQEAVCRTVRENGIRQGAVKIMGYNPEIAFDILPSCNTLDIAVFVIDPVQDLGKRVVPASGGADLCVSTWCKLDPRTVPVTAKAAANYLNGMLARQEAKNRGCDMAVMLDTRGFVAEGATESIFLVKDGRIMTPSMGGILHSITRSSVITLCQTLEIPVNEDRIPPELLETADEIFFSCTPMKVLPIKTCEQRALSPVPGPVTRQVADVMADVTAGRNRQFEDWLFPVS